jgi:hypothetical protein
MIGEILEFIRRMSISGNQIQRDAAVLRAEVGDLKKELIPFTHSEMELLSLSYIDKGIRRGFAKSIKGLFNTIFFEPLFAFAVKDYGPHTRLIFITTSDREILYFVKDKITQVYFDGRQLGVLDVNGKLYNLRNQVIAEIDGNDNIATHRVLIMGEDFGFIANPRFEKTKENRRAFQMLKEMSEDQGSIFLSLTLLNLVEESLT